MAVSGSGTGLPGSSIVNEHEQMLYDLLREKAFHERHIDGAMTERRKGRSEAFFEAATLVALHQERLDRKPKDG